MPATADTLLINYSATVSDLSIPEEHANLYEVFESDDSFDEFDGQITPPNFEDYQTGVHEIDVYSNGLQLSLVSGLHTGFEAIEVSFVAPTQTTIHPT